MSVIIDPTEKEREAFWEQLKQYDSRKVDPLSPRSFKWGRNYRFRCCYLLKDAILSIFNRCCSKRVK